MVTRSYSSLQAGPGKGGKAESGGKERNALFQVIIMFRGETLQINTVTNLDY
mgnify:CR=1 FL=1